MGVRGSVAGRSRCSGAPLHGRPQRKPFEIEWDFGDGRGTASTAQTCHEYIEPGLYAASVTVADDEGLRDSRTVVVFVRENRRTVAVEPLGGALGPQEAT